MLRNKFHTRIYLRCIFFVFQDISTSNTEPHTISTAKVAEKGSFDNVTTEEVEVLSTDGIEIKDDEKIIFQCDICDFESNWSNG